MFSSRVKDQIHIDKDIRIQSVIFCSFIGLMAIEISFSEQCSSVPLYIKLHLFFFVFWTGRNSFESLFLFLFL